MKKRILAAFFSGLLASGVVSGQQDDGGPGQPGEASSGKAFRLTGVLISDTRQTAIVNGRILSEGDRVGAAEIVDIAMGEVRVLRDGKEFTVRIGQSLSASPMTRANMPDPHSRAERAQPAPSRPDVAADARIDPDVEYGEIMAQHAVRPGETLSEIALQYLAEGIALNDMMTALFRANAEAFGGDADLLFAGAVLHIPDLNDLERPDPGIALAALTAETGDMLPAAEGVSAGGDIRMADRYGPIRAGESLSGIVPRFLEDGMTREQLMIAILRSNPHAFGDNVNILYEGALLHIPTGREIYAVSPTFAAAKIAEQTDLWHAGRERHASSRADLPGIMARTEAPPR